MPLPIAASAIVTIRRRRWRVTRVATMGAVTRVDAVPLAAAGAPPTSFLVPFDEIDVGRVSARPRRVRRQRWRAVLAGLRAQAEHVDLPLAAVRADIAVLPYQLEPVLAARDAMRRLLIADAVGLGKTIQAGLVIAELCRRGEAARVLVAAPGHLCAQWRDELHARFRLPSRSADASTLAELAGSLPRDVSAWSLAGIWVGSLDFLKQPHVLDAMPASPWDVVVIDEAHAATGHSDRHSAAQAIGTCARRLLLLTATPLSGMDDGRALMELGAVDRAEPLTMFRRSRQDVGIDAPRHVRRLHVVPAVTERLTLDLLDAFAAAAESAATASTADATHLLVSVFRKRALSTFAALSISLDRRLAHLAGAPAPLIDAAQTSFDFGDDDIDAVTMTIGLATDRERSWLRRLRAAAQSAARVSRKVVRLTSLLTRTREPAIVFTEFRDSLETVAIALRRAGLPVAAVHGRLSPTEMQLALETFRNGNARILLATDVASQGLNLHERARWVIHLDLPWNPIRLEQRAGRVDRLGQARVVHVTYLLLAHAHDRALSERLARRTQAVETQTTVRSDRRWLRRARAAARVLEQRRLHARRWRTGAAAGRPMSHPNADDDVWSHDIDGVETLITAARDRADAAVSRRAQRVARIVAARCQRNLAIEREQHARITSMRRAKPQLSLPGAATAEHASADARHDTALTEAARCCTARITALEARARSPLAVSSRPRLLRR